VQASSAWAPPGGTLGAILETTRERVASLDKEWSGVPRVAAHKPVRGRPYLEQPSLKAALRREHVAVIAEIKRKSPSKGALNDALDAGTQAAFFERGGAAAISVLTEPTYFGGSMEDLVDVACATQLPLLKKDFHIDPLQLLEARRGQPSAILLIARALPQSSLLNLMMVARSGRLEVVVEVRTEAELDRALEAGAEMVGVNSRDLETLEVDDRVPELLMPRIPSSVIGIWESGVSSVDDVRRAAYCGADAVLVGSALSRSSDPESLVRSLAQVPRRDRHD
jgi:indole-3-glycerol phosphate synthase